MCWDFNSVRGEDTHVGHYLQRVRKVLDLSFEVRGKIPCQSLVLDPRGTCKE